MKSTGVYWFPSAAFKMMIQHCFQCQVRPRPFGFTSQDIIRSPVAVDIAFPLLVRTTESKLLSSISERPLCSHVSIFKAFSLLLGSKYVLLEISGDSRRSVLQAVIQCCTLAALQTASWAQKLAERYGQICSLQRRKSYCAHGMVIHRLVPLARMCGVFVTWQRRICDGNPLKH